MRKFDLIVIGSGSGLEVSADVSDAGQSVAIIEKGPTPYSPHHKSRPWA
jgi:pyruvate/2-oxoglutarate dehydrogenase complex dihydrolipoamide dehydrogenase (E3) component|tara:strand:+ start:93993 stop:94139 length:147 start_codon:yes stop_codon:yes gene_type:complete